MLTCVLALTVVLHVVATEPSDAVTSARDARTEIGIEVVVAGPAAARGRVLDRLPEFLDGLGVPVQYVQREVLSVAEVVEPPADPRPARARVWIDVTRPSVAHLYVADGPWDRIVVRRLRLQAGIDEVAREEIGYVLESALEALLAGGKIGIERSEAARELGHAASKPEPAPRQRPPRRGSITLGGGASVGAWGTGVVQWGPLVVVEGAAGGAHVVGGGRVEGRFAVPVRHDRAGLELGLLGGGMRGYGTLEVKLPASWSLDFAGGPGLEIVRGRARPRVDAAEGFPSSLQVLPVLAAAAGPQVEIGRRRDRLLLRLQIMMDVLPRQARYVTRDTEEIVFDPWTVRPVGVLTLGWRRIVSPSV